MVFRREGRGGLDRGGTDKTKAGGQHNSITPIKQSGKRLRRAPAALASANGRRLGSRGRKVKVATPLAAYWRPHAATALRAIVRNSKRLSWRARKEERSRHCRPVSPASRGFARALHTPRGLKRVSRRPPPQPGAGIKIGGGMRSKKQFLIQYDFTIFIKNLSIAMATPPPPLQILLRSGGGISLIEYVPAKGEWR